MKMGVTGSIYLRRWLSPRHCLENRSTAATGSDEYNISLSRPRAEAAWKYLADGFGIATSRMSASGIRKSDPIAPNDNEDDRGRNRRVDFIFSSDVQPKSNCQ
jgi:flagellar motor protein MotB